MLSLVLRKKWIVHAWNVYISNSAWEPTSAMSQLNDLILRCLSFLPVQKIPWVNMCEAGWKLGSIQLVWLGMIIFRGYYILSNSDETLCLFTEAPALFLDFWNAQRLSYRAGSGSPATCFAKALWPCTNSQPCDTRASTALSLTL